MIETRTATDIALPLSVPRAIRLHGIVTERLAAARHNLDLLVLMRGTITDIPDVSEEILSDAIRDYDRILADLDPILYGPAR